jgi:hypothetical protein
VKEEQSGISGCKSGDGDNDGYDSFWRKTTCKGMIVIHFGLGQDVRALNTKAGNFLIR